MLHDFAYIQLTVADFDRSVAFYRDALGMMLLLWHETRQGHAAMDTSAGLLVLRSDGGSALAFALALTITHIPCGTSQY